MICCNFLSYKNIYLYDCIVGNPPFQNDYGKTKTNKHINGGKSKLYEHIFLKAFEMLNNNGYLSFLVPNNIFSSNLSKPNLVAFLIIYG